MTAAEQWLDGYRSGLGMAAIKAGELARLIRSIAPNHGADTELAAAVAHPLDTLAIALRIRSACASLSDVPRSAGDA